MANKVNAKDKGLRWLVVKYAPVSLFSLRMTRATSKGAKTLLVPTPYSFKMALLDACFRAFQYANAETKARELFNAINKLEISFSPPRCCIVQNTFVKIRQEERDAPKGFFVPTIAYREFCFFSGDELQTALMIADLEDKEITLIEKLCKHVNCIGKRGSFWQYTGKEIVHGNLPHGFTYPVQDNFITDGEAHWLQELDDFGQPLWNDNDGFDRVSTYNAKPLMLGEHRVLLKTLLPYRFVRSSKHFTQFERSDGKK